MPLHEILQTINLIASVLQPHLVIHQAPAPASLPHRPSQEPPRFSNSRPHPQPHGPPRHWLPPPPRPPNPERPMQPIDSRPTLRNNGRPRTVGMYNFLPIYPRNRIRIPHNTLRSPNRATVQMSTDIFGDRFMKLNHLRITNGDDNIITPSNQKERIEPPLLDQNPQKLFRADAFTINDLAEPIINLERTSIEETNNASQILQETTMTSQNLDLNQEKIVNPNISLISQENFQTKDEKLSDLISFPSSCIGTVSAFSKPIRDFEGTTTDKINSSSKSPFKKLMVLPDFHLNEEKEVEHNSSLIPLFEKDPKFSDFIVTSPKSIQMSATITLTKPLSDTERLDIHEENNSPKTLQHEPTDLPSSGLSGERVAELNRFATFQETLQLKNNKNSDLSAIPPRLNQTSSVVNTLAKPLSDDQRAKTDETNSSSKNPTILPSLDLSEDINFSDFFSIPSQAVLVPVQNTLALAINDDQRNDTDDVNHSQENLQEKQTVLPNLELIKPISSLVSQETVHLKTKNFSDLVTFPPRPIQFESDGTAFQDDFSRNPARVEPQRTNEISFIPPPPDAFNPNGELSAAPAGADINAPLTQTLLEPILFESPARAPTVVTSIPEAKRQKRDLIVETTTLKSSEIVVVPSEPLALAKPNLPSRTLVNATRSPKKKVKIPRTRQNKNRTSKLRSKTIKNEGQRKVRSKRLVNFSSVVQRYHDYLSRLIELLFKSDKTQFNTTNDESQNLPEPFTLISSSNNEMYEAILTPKGEQYDEIQNINLSPQKKTSLVWHILKQPWLYISRNTSKGKQKKFPKKKSPQKQGFIYLFPTYYTAPQVSHQSNPSIYTKNSHLSPNNNYLHSNAITNFATYADPYRSQQITQRPFLSSWKTGYFSKAFVPSVNNIPVMQSIKVPDDYSRNRPGYVRDPIMKKNPQKIETGDALVINQLSLDSNDRDSPRAGDPMNMYFATDINSHEDGTEVRGNLNNEKSRGKLLTTPLVHDSSLNIVDIRIHEIENSTSGPLKEKSYLYFEKNSPYHRNTSKGTDKNFAASTPLDGTLYSDFLSQVESLGVIDDEVVENKMEEQLHSQQTPESTYINIFSQNNSDVNFDDYDLDNDNHDKIDAESFIDFLALHNPRTILTDSGDAETVKRTNEEDLKERVSEEEQSQYLSESDFIDPISSALISSGLTSLEKNESISEDVFENMVNEQGQSKIFARPKQKQDKEMNIFHLLGTFEMEEFNELQKSKHRSESLEEVAEEALLHTHDVESPVRDFCIHRSFNSRFRDIAYLFSWDDAILENTTVPWVDARNFCRRQCMELVSLSEEEEETFVYRMMTYGGIPMAWTSGKFCEGKDCYTTSPWLWSGITSKVVPVTNWLDGQPDNHMGNIGGDLEACAAAEIYGDLAGVSDADCNKSLPFICKDNDDLLRSVGLL